MRKLVLSMQVSLDGFIEGPNGELDWAVKEDEETWHYIFDVQRSADTLLMGRVMYPAFERYWQAAPTNPLSSKNEVDYARLADSMKKVVVSKTLAAAAWKNTTILRDHVADEIRRMKERPGKNMVVLGGATLASSLMDLGLIDEYHFIVNPVVLGGGKRLFQDARELRAFKLLGYRIFRSGKVALHYGNGENGPAKGLV